MKIKQKHLATFDAVQWTGSNTAEIVSFADTAERIDIQATNKKIIIYGAGRVVKLGHGDWLIKAPEGYEMLTDSEMQSKYDQA
jgi:hypothetical protein